MDRDLSRLSSIKTDFLLFNHRLSPSVDFDKISGHLENLENRLRRLTPTQIQRLVFHVDYYQLLTSIQFELDISIRNSTGSQKILLVRFKDRIFRSLLSSMEEPTDVRRVTNAFNKFVKGVTYFQHEAFYKWGIVRDPIYHRKGSCSKKGSPNFSCIGATNRSTRRSNGHLIEVCYIERLIYDELWQRINQTQQDGNHLRWLSETRREYSNCHPMMSLEIEVEIDDNNVPHALHIRRFLDGLPFSHEYYSKPFDSSENDYSEYVQCVRVRNGHPKPQTYEKTSHFTHKGQWNKVD